MLSQLHLVLFLRFCLVLLCGTCFSVSFCLILCFYIYAFGKLVTFPNLREVILSGDVLRNLAVYASLIIRAISSKGSLCMGYMNPSLLWAWLLWGWPSALLEARSCLMQWLLAHCWERLGPCLAGCMSYGVPGLGPNAADRIAWSVLGLVMAHWSASKPSALIG